MNQQQQQQTTTTLQLLLLTQESAHAAMMMIALKDRIALLFPGGNTRIPVQGCNWQIWVNEDALGVAGYVDVQAADKFAETSDYFTFSNIILLIQIILFLRVIITLSFSGA